MVESLEPRRLLSGDPAQLIAKLPSTNDNINVDFTTSAQAGGKLFLSGPRETDPDRLWVVNDASINPTQLFNSISQGTNFGIEGLTPYHDQLYFFANTATGDGLFRTDGTVAGTQAVKILRTGSTNTLPAQTFSLNDRIYFFWNNVSQPAKLYESDGTSAGTNAIWTASTGLFPTGFSEAVGGFVYFGAGGKLWRTNGTAAGTTAAWTDPTGNTPSNIVVANNRLFFISAGSTLQRLYTADLDGSNVTQISIPPVNSSEAAVGGKLAPVSNGVVFLAGTRIFAADGTPSGTVLLSDNAAVDPFTGPGFATFFRNVPNTTLYEWWGTDGTVAGTSALLNKRFEPARTPIVGNASYAFAIDRTSTTGIRIYESNGTPAGTRLIQFVSATTSSSLHHLTTFQDRLVIETLDVVPTLWSLDFNTPTGSIGGGAYYDVNHNGKREGFEYPISGKPYLDLNNNGSWDAGELWGTTENGVRYQFDGLPAVHYFVRFAPHASSETITSPAGAAYDLVLGGGQTITDADFVGTDNSPLIWGYVFNDLNGNDVRDAGEPGIGGQQFVLASGHDYTRYSAADGSYGFFGQASGPYTIRRIMSYGWTQSDATRGGVPVTATSGIVRVADLPLIAAVAGGIQGYIYDDKNADGYRNAGDAPLFNTVAFLDLNRDGVWDLDAEPYGYTDFNGRYQITSEPGHYTLALAETYYRQRQTFPANGAGQAITVESNLLTQPPDFLVNASNAPAPTGAISGRVWSDHDGNGAHDPDEPPGWGITLWFDSDDDGVLDAGERSTVTAADGSYVFPKVAAGTYHLWVLLSSEWTQTAPLGAATISLANGAQKVVPDFQIHSTDASAPTVVSAAFDREGTLPTARIQLSEDVLGTLETGDVTLVDPITLATLPYNASGVAFDPGTNTAAFSLPTNLPNGNYRAIIAHDGVSDVAGNTLADDGIVDFFVLHGDGDGNRKVDIADFNRLAGNFGKPGMTFSQGNYDYSADGQINILDFNELAANFGQHVDPPAVVQARTTSIGVVSSDRLLPLSRYSSDLVEII